MATWRSAAPAGLVALPGLVVPSGDSPYRASAGPPLFLPKAAEGHRCCPWVCAARRARGEDPRQTWIRSATARGEDLRQTWIRSATARTISSIASSTLTPLR